MVKSQAEEQALVVEGAGKAQSEKGRTLAEMENSRCEKPAGKKMWKMLVKIRVANNLWE